MADLRLTEAESSLAEIIWEHEPLESKELVRLCEAILQWKKSTTYTMLKRLENKGIFANNSGIVSSLLKKEVFFAKQSKHFVDSTFSGSLPRFLTAFTKEQKLSDRDIEELQQLIDRYREQE